MLFAFMNIVFVIRDLLTYLLDGLSLWSLLHSILSLGDHIVYTYGDLPQATQIKFTLILSQNNTIYIG